MGVFHQQKNEVYQRKSDFTSNHGSIVKLCEFEWWKKEFLPKPAGDRKCLVKWVKALLFAGGCPKAIFLHLIWINCSDLTTTSPRVLCLPSSDVFHADLQQKVPPTQRIDLREIRHPWVFYPPNLAGFNRACSVFGQDTWYFQSKGFLYCVTVSSSPDEYRTKYLLKRYFIPQIIPQSKPNLFPNSENHKSMGYMVLTCVYPSNESNASKTHKTTVVIYDHYVV